MYVNAQIIRQIYKVLDALTNMKRELIAFIVLGVLLVSLAGSVSAATRGGGSGEIILSPEEKEELKDAPAQIGGDKPILLISEDYGGYINTHKPEIIIVPGFPLLEVPENTRVQHVKNSNGEEVIYVSIINRQGELTFYFDGVERTIKDEEEEMLKPGFIRERVAESPLQESGGEDQQGAMSFEEKGLFDWIKKINPFEYVRKKVNEFIRGLFQN